MYIKKYVLVISAILLIAVTVFLTLGVVNPFGFRHMDDFFWFSYVAKTIDRNFYRDVDGETLLNGAIEGMTDVLQDPYTGYYWGEKAVEYLEDMEGSYCGIGIYIENCLDDNTIRVISAIAGSPAEEAGVKAGDKILKVNGTSYSGQEISEASAAVKGKEGTEVMLTIWQEEDAAVRDVVLVRRKITIENVTGSMINEQVGMIQLTQFTTGSAEKFREKFYQLKEEGMKSLIIDLRNNPGGLMDETVKIASLFVEKDKVIVYTEDKAGHREDYLAEGETEQMPIVLLTNPMSASASEVLTGALKDYGIGYQIGEKTFGKGVVQGVIQTKKPVVLSLTVARYFTPKGVCIHEKGIEPDLVIPMDAEKYQNLSQLAPEEDEQLQAALEYLNT